MGGFRAGHAGLPAVPCHLLGPQLCKSSALCPEWLSTSHRQVLAQSKANREHKQEAPRIQQQRGNEPAQCERAARWRYTECCSVLSEIRSHPVPVFFLAALFLSQPPWFTWVFPTYPSHLHSWATSSGKPFLDSTQLSLCRGGFSPSLLALCVRRLYVTTKHLQKPT